MDLFYDNLNFPRKKRTHFNEFMLEVHDNLHKLRSKITYKNSDMDPLYILATEMAKETISSASTSFKLLTSLMLSFSKDCSKSYIKTTW